MLNLLFSNKLGAVKIMNKVEIESKIAHETGISKKTVSTIVESFLSTVTDTLSEGETVRLVGFGTFQTTERKERVGVNPSNGEKITIPASKKPSFRAGKTLKDAVNKN